MSGEDRTVAAISYTVGFLEGLLNISIGGIFRFFKTVFQKVSEAVKEQ